MMSNTKYNQRHNVRKINRRRMIAMSSKSLFSFFAGMTTSTFVNASVLSTDETIKEENAIVISPEAFVYTELQISVPFYEAPWKDINLRLLDQPGLLNKTWLSGIGNNSLGGIYAFDSIENAKKFVTVYFPEEAKRYGVAQTSRIFDAKITKEASNDMNSLHFDSEVIIKPGAFVYTEVQANIPFENVPWKERNVMLKQQSGLLSKTWLSGLNTNTIGGIDVFDSIENAKEFALNTFPTVTKKMGAAFYTRVFDANIVEEASIQMNSPFFKK